MRQTRFVDGTFKKHHKRTRKEQFLAEMGQIIPWKELSKVIAPYYPKPKVAGRRPVGVERMLRIYFMQHWFNLSDPGAEEALYDMEVLRQFAGIELGRELVPDETTICKFRHLMERKNLGDALFAWVNEYLAENGLAVSRRTIVDATLIDAPTSTENKEGKRDPEMYHPVGRRLSCVRSTSGGRARFVPRSRQYHPRQTPKEHTEQEVRDQGGDDPLRAERKTQEAPADDGKKIGGSCRC